MTKSEVYYLIPKSFTIACHEIKVVVKDVDEQEKDNDRYGYYSDVKNEIVIFLGTSDADFSEEQILNTFYHELTHCFMFFSGMEQNEMVAQTFANHIREYEITKQIQK